MTLLDAIRDPALFAPWFRDPGTWKAWRAFLAALLVLPPPDPESLDIYQRHTGLKCLPLEPVSEAWVVVGRRGGKSLIAVLVAVYLAVLRDYSHVLAPGERGTVMVLAADRRQARTVLRYIAAFIDQVPMLTKLIGRRGVEEIYLTNRVSIEVHTASFRSVRGYTLLGATADEVAFWRDESTSNPDAEIIAALRPGMATVPGALLLGISSPYSRRGVLWDAHRRHFGVDGSPVLVRISPPWKSSCRWCERSSRRSSRRSLPTLRRDASPWVRSSVTGGCGSMRTGQSKALRCWSPKCSRPRSEPRSRESRW